MSQVKTKSNKLKVSAKRSTALISAVALSIFGLVATSSAANAAAVTKFSQAQIQRTVTSDTFVLRANETLITTVNAAKTSFVSDGVKSISSNHTITPSISGVTYGQKSFDWSLDGCVPFNVRATTATPCPDATVVRLFVSQELTNTTSAPITITTNFSSAKFTYGSDEISASQANISASKFVARNDPMATTGLVITSDDRFVNAFIETCLDDTLYDVGETLTWETSASIDGVPLASEVHMTDAYMTFKLGPNPLTSFTVPADQGTTLTIAVNGENMGQKPGTLSVSVDLKSGQTSVLKTCPSGGGGNPPPPLPLFPVGAASVNGKFSVGSKITVTPNTWSSTVGGAQVTATTNFNWFVCDAPVAASTTIFMDQQCFMPGSPPPEVLADGSSVGVTNGPNQSFNGASLTITQDLITAMTGKHLMVRILGLVSSPTEFKVGVVWMKTCGPIVSGLSCSSTFGTAAPIAEPTDSTTPTPTPAPSTPAPSTPALTTVTAPTVGTAAALAALPKSATQPKLKFGSSANGLGKSAKRSLKRVATVAKDGYGVRVTGSAGMQPGVSKKAVRALAKKRAMEIRAYLIKQGVPKEDIIIKTKVVPIGKMPSTLVKVETLD